MYLWGQSTKNQGHRFKRCIFGVNIPKIKVIFVKDVFFYKPSPNLYIYAGGDEKSLKFMSSSTI